MSNPTDNDDQSGQLEDLDPAEDSAEDAEVDGFLLDNIVAPKVITPERPNLRLQTKPTGIDPIAGVRG